MARTLKGKSHGKLGLHRKSGNDYVSKRGYHYKRTKKGFEYVSGKKPKKKPYNPLEPLTGKGLNREVNAATELRYGGQRRSLASEYRVSQAQQARTASWYDSYKNTVDQATAAQAAQAAQAQQAVYNQANTASGQDEANRAKVTAEAQKSAAVRGTSASVQPEAQQANQATRALSSAWGGMIGAQQQAGTRYMGQLGIAGQQAKIGALQDEERRKRQITSAARDLAGEAGQYRVQYRGDLRDKERTYALNQQAFGLDVAKQQDTAAHQKRQDANVKRGQNLVNRSKKLDRELRARLKKIDAGLKNQGLSETHRHNLATERESINKRLAGGDSGGHSKKWRTDYDKAYSLVRGASGKKGRVGSRKWRQDTLDYLVGTKGLNRNAAHSALRKYYSRWRRKNSGRKNAKGKSGYRPT